jgi:exopolyphosphatase / guanosine-5'-triphosphate,3'-diphosphate pyrophosphatase
MVMKFAAIDLGSNAVRLLICHVYDQLSEHPRFKKGSLVRVPLRLGEDAFRLGYLQEHTIERLVKTMRAFQLLIDVEEPIAWRACGTSALREASNAASVVQRVQDEASLTIDIISGDEEACLIYANHIEQHIDPKKTYLYIDVGGGSTELTLYQAGERIISRSFDIGTVRILAGQINQDRWNTLQNWVKNITQAITEPIYGIGSGGNINKLRGMTVGKKSGKPITYAHLKTIYQQLSQATFEERMELLGLNPDRADVIVPACEIYFAIMETANIESIYVPEVGLADGIVHLLYEAHRRQSTPLSL